MHYEVKFRQANGPREKNDPKSDHIDVRTRKMLWNFELP